MAENFFEQLDRQDKPAQNFFAQMDGASARQPANPDAAATGQSGGQAAKSNFFAQLDGGPTLGELAAIKPPQTPGRSWGDAVLDPLKHMGAAGVDAVRDLGYAFGKSQNSGFQSPEEKALGPGSDFYTNLSGASDYLRGSVSDYNKWLHADVQQKIDQAKQRGQLAGMWEAFRQNATSPTLLADSAASSVPDLAAIIGASTLAGPVGGAAAGGAIFGGHGASSTYWAAFDAAIAQGLPEDQARRVAQDASGTGAWVGGASGAAMGLLGPGRALAGGALPQVAAKVATNRTAAAGLSAAENIGVMEGTALAQQGATNYEVGKIDGKTRLTDNFGAVAGEALPLAAGFAAAGATQAARTAGQKAKVYESVKKTSEQLGLTPEQAKAAAAQAIRYKNAASETFSYAGYGKFRNALEWNGKGPDANPNSSALGPHQFIEGTWLNLIAKHQPAWAEGLSRNELLALRRDPAKSVEMVQHLDQANAAELRREGVPVNNETLYAAHHFGPAKAAQLHRAPLDMPAERIFSQTVLDANPYLKGKTKAQVLGNWRARAAKAGVDMPAGDAAAVDVQRSDTGPEHNSAAPEPVDDAWAAQEQQRLSVVRLAFGVRRFWLNAQRKTLNVKLQKKTGDPEQCCEHLREPRTRSPCLRATARPATCAQAGPSLPVITPTAKGLQCRKSDAAHVTVNSAKATTPTFQSNARAAGH